MESISFYRVTAEEINDKHGPAIMLTQTEDCYDESNAILVHPWQLRAICEHLGIIASDAETEKRIATLERRMSRLNARIQALRDYMAEHSDHEHADLSYEMAQLNALADVSGEWCAEWQMEDLEPCKDSQRQVAQPEQGELAV